MKREEAVAKKEEIFKEVYTRAMIALLHISEDNSLRRVVGFLPTVEVLESVDLMGNDVDEAIYNLVEFKKRVKELREKYHHTSIIADEKADSEYGDNDAWICEFGYKLVEYSITKEHIETVQKKEFREWIGEKLELGGKVPSCELIEVFLDGDIIWEIFKKMAQKNCEI